MHHICSLLLRLFIPLSLASIAHADNKNAHLPTIPLTIFDQKFIAEVAASDASRAQQNALRRLVSKNILTKMDYGVYQFEDESFADWVKHKD